MKRTIKKIIHSNNSLFNFYYSYIYKPKDELSIFLDNYSRSNKRRLFFIQVGANDGQWGDPIYKFIRRDKWSGVLIEPQKQFLKDYGTIIKTLITYILKMWRLTQLREKKFYIE